MDLTIWRSGDAAQAMPWDPEGVDIPPQVTARYRLTQYRDRGSVFYLWQQIRPPPLAGE